jgi:hypothetical protein
MGEGNAFLNSKFKPRTVRTFGKAETQFHRDATHAMEYRKHLVHGRKQPIKEYNSACNRPWRPRGLRDVEAPTFSGQIIQIAVLLSALRIDHALRPRKFPAIKLILMTCKLRKPFSFFACTYVRE